MDQAVQKGAGGHHHRPGPDGFLEGGDAPRPPGHFRSEAVDHRLADIQVRLVFHDLLHPQPVAQPVGLGPGGPDRRAFAGIEPPELDAGGVDIFGHFAAQGIDLLDQMAFGQAADGRIAGHGADGVDVDDADRRAAAQRAAARAASQPAWPAPITAMSNISSESVHVILHSVLSAVSPGCL